MYGFAGVNRQDWNEIADITRKHIYLEHKAVLVHMALRVELHTSS